MRPIYQCALVAAMMTAAPAMAEPIILNEYNAVSSGEYLDAETYAESTKADVRFGRIESNGGNWFELVVTEDHLDIRGWEFRWAETGSTDTDGTDVWYGDGSLDQGILKLSSNAAFSDLRSGTIITISEDTVINDESGDTVVNGSDVSYDPNSGDWWIHLNSFDATYFDHSTDTTNVNGDDKDGAFSVGNDDWELTIVDDLGTLQFGPAGEAIDDEGVNSNEVFKLEADPSDTLVIGDPSSDYNDGTSSTFGLPNDWSGGDSSQDFSVLRSAVPEPASVMLLIGGATMLLGNRRRR